MSFRDFRSSWPAGLVVAALLTGCQAAPPASADDESAANASR